MVNLAESLVRTLLAAYKRRKRACRDLSLENCLAAAMATASRAKYGFLITLGDTGWPSARLVEPISDFDDFVFRVGTSPTSRKVEELEVNPKVILAFDDATERANLVIYGTATVSADVEIRRRYWKGIWRLFFPNGPVGDDYAVIQIRADRMELMNFRRNVIPEPFGLCPMVLERSAEAWRFADAGKSQQTRAAG
jgi:general stress protein 26